MRKIILSLMVSLDGFVEGPNNDISWHRMNEEMNGDAIDLLNSVDTILFGRRTYQLFESFWPSAANDPKFSENDRIIGQRICDLDKIVFSKTLERVEWQHSTLLRSIDPEAIQKLKHRRGKDMVIFGSAAVGQAFMNFNLIDDYRLFVNPVILGRGTPLFLSSHGLQSLILAGAKTFGTGVVGLYYQACTSA